MSAVFKSTNAYSGPAALRNVSEMAVSVDTLTEAYRQRVQADGGEIIDVAAVRSAYAWMIANGVTDKCIVAAGPNLGIRRDGTVVNKLYTLNYMASPCEDLFVINGLPALGTDTSSAGRFSVMTFGSGVVDNDWMRTKRPIQLTGNWVWAGVGKDNALADTSYNLSMLSEGDYGFTPRGFMSLGSPASTSDTNAMAIGVRRANGTTTIGASATPYAAYAGLAAAIDAAAKSNTIYVDGVAGTTNTQADLYDYSANPQYLYGGAKSTANTAVITPSLGTTAEIWLVRGVTNPGAIAQSLSAFLGLRF
jgi:hypothetical protein